LTENCFISLVVLLAIQTWSRHLAVSNAVKCYGNRCTTGCFQKIKNFPQNGAVARTTSNETVQRYANISECGEKNSRKKGIRPRMQPSLSNERDDVDEVPVGTFICDGANVSCTKVASEDTQTDSRLAARTDINSSLSFGAM